MTCTCGGCMLTGRDSGSGPRDWQWRVYCLACGRVAPASESVLEAQSSQRERLRCLGCGVRGKVLMFRHPVQP